MPDTEPTAAPIAAEPDAAREILVINPGATTTKIALFRNEQPLFSVTEEHSRVELAPFHTAPAMAQHEFRRECVARVLREHGREQAPLAAVAGRGGLLAPMEGGTYAVTERMLDDLREARHGEHPCNLGAWLARDFAEPRGVPAFVVDPPIVDELADEARLTGLPEISRRSVFHALSQKAAARRAASIRGTSYDQANFIVTHMGGGISVGAHLRGRVAEVNDALEGDGPFSPERTGGLPVLPLMRLLQDGALTFEQLRRKVLKEGGLWAHLGTNDLREVSARMERGDADAARLFEALAYAVARSICGCAAILRGEVDAVVLTGGLARGAAFVERISERVRFLGPVIVLPEVEEMEALCAGALRVLRGEEKAREYTG